MDLEKILMIIAFVMAAVAFVLMLLDIHKESKIKRIAMTVISVITLGICYTLPFI